MLSILRFHHIGYVVHSISETAEYYINAGWTKTEEIFDPLQNSNISYLTRTGFPLIELVAPANKDSPVLNILKNAGVSTYHICYEVDDMKATITELRKKKFIPLFCPVKAMAINTSEICYLYNSKVGLIEIMCKA